MSDRDDAAQWARDLLATEFVILDSETTGLDTSAEIVQLAIIDYTGATVLDTLIKPVLPIPRIATGIHGITDAMVKDAPTFEDIFDQLLMAIGGKRVVIYNMDFDRKMLHQSEQWHQMRRNHDWPCMGMEAWRLLSVWVDAMIPYSNWVGEWSDYHGNNRWQPLPGGDHTALGDCRATLAVIRKMTGVLNSAITVPVMDDELHGYEMHYSKFYKDGDYNHPHDSALADALSAFVADLVASYSQRGRSGRENLAHAWLNQWRRELGWRPIFESQQKEATE
jgi:DNA polymerase-3 subunit epsilon